jgi:hypothetical protein
MGILDGVDGIFDRHLQVEHIGGPPHHRHRKSALLLSAGRPAGFDAEQLLEEAYARLVSNLGRSPRFGRSGPSTENWRFEKQLGCSDNNQSLEVTLERAIVAAIGPEWANQVPTASGLWDSVADKRCAVDLVRRLADGRFELIELKVESDTPLRAAVEITQYGLLYAVARGHYQEIDRASSELLRADEIDLRVLAPATYYAPYSLGWLADDLDEAARAFTTQRFGGQFTMSFGFEAFPHDFNWPSRADLMDWLRRRSRVWSAKPPTAQCRRS